MLTRAVVVSRPWPTALIIIVIVKPDVVSAVHRMNEEHGFMIRRHRPERIERRVIQVAVIAVQLCADHHAGQTLAHQPFEEKCGFFAVLQSDRAECP